MCEYANCCTNTHSVAAARAGARRNPHVRSDTLRARALDPAPREEYSICNQPFRIKIAPETVVKLHRRTTLLGSKAISRLRNRRLARSLAEDGERLVTASDLRVLRAG